MEHWRLSRLYWCRPIRADIIVTKLASFHSFHLHLFPKLSLIEFNRTFNKCKRIVFQIKAWLLLTLLESMKAWLRVLILLVLNTLLKHRFRAEFSSWVKPQTIQPWYLKRYLPWPPRLTYRARSAVKSLNSVATTCVLSLQLQFDSATNNIWCEKASKYRWLENSIFMFSFMRLWRMLIL